MIQSATNIPKSKRWKHRCEVPECAREAAVLLKAKRPEWAMAEERRVCLEHFEEMDEPTGDAAPESEPKQPEPPPPEENPVVHDQYSGDVEKLRLMGTGICSRAELAKLWDMKEASAASNLSRFKGLGLVYQPERMKFALTPEGCALLAQHDKTEEAEAARAAVAPEPIQKGDAMKHDGGKAPWQLLPLEPTEEIVKALQFGAQKYSANQWRKGMAYSRLVGALFRHVTARVKGEKIDPESGLNHLAHAGCCVLFMLTYDLNEAYARFDDLAVPEPLREAS